ncbi:ubiquitin-binding ESCRT-I subunit protein STP22 KNAG_0I01190 [Huiozyma naganishii CBS 8797]|uniref:UEV domain-containing protein n=1 Tax=Huiozyma naganishii (strain ATCC MYA-139 / BCRC 22969 / CBS 8797 / KCTC 17520 / NBRC 10181 / NCYC 3082 / Yp74L-3) TaxID=1071383 RepID=J7RAK5_HUIN7|nr:hypothetical protein KNAG_0I01190 [Kazachstania naganishii CBS 8797]CCK71910.1 hypothetical protein KNAG_0I01190 [Kazachstania naganishii CBS 8797]
MLASNGGQGSLGENLPKSVIDWLYKVVQSIYKTDPRAAFHDCVVALSLYKSNLRPRTRVFTNPSGEAQLLLCLYGDFVNVQVSGPVPILIWVCSQYPLKAPVVFVDVEKLGPDREVRVGGQIDSNGQIYLPILHQWDPKLSNVVKLIKELETLIQTQQLVTELGRQSPETPAIPKDTRSTGDKPPLPLKPNQSISSPKSIDPERQQAYPKTIAETLPPPIPARPGFVSPQPLPNRRISPPVAREPVNRPTPLADLDLMDTDLPLNTKDDPHKQALDILTKKLEGLTVREHSVVAGQFGQRKASIEKSIAQFNDLLAFETQQVELMGDQVAQYTSSLRREMKRLDNNVSDWEANYEKAGSTARLHHTETSGLDQLYDLVAQDLALDDTIEFLYSLLNRDSLSLDLYVRKTRALAKQQFMIRLHIEKICNMLNATPQGLAG